MRRRSQLLKVVGFDGHARPTLVLYFHLSTTAETQYREFLGPVAHLVER